MSTTRRLAAILAADVVGYSRLMEADEAGTLAALKARRREVLEPLVAKHQGRIFKVTGDGVLAEFASAGNAVQCAVDLQQGMATANSGDSEGRHIILRIGVNLATSWQRHSYQTAALPLGKSSAIDTSTGHSYNLRHRAR